MNIWRRGPLTRNPYYRTAFRLARLSREIARRQIIVAMIGQTRRLVNTDPDSHKVAGEPVNPADLNAAEQILLDVYKRIPEELLEHAEEKPPVEGVRSLLSQLAAELDEGALEPLCPVHLDGLRPWAYELACQALDDGPKPSPSFGALELRIVPPFGAPEKE